MPDTEPQEHWSARWEGVIAALILFSFLLISLAVATRTPTVFMDEVVYTDPAANLYFGRGFTSTMWAQDRHEFWCGNVPLYQGFLYAAFKIFGFGLRQARMTSEVLAAAGALLTWAALRFNRLVKTSRGRLLALALILSGSVSTQTFRMIRYDSAMFFVCALVFFACSLPRPWRYPAAIVASAQLPFAGVPLLPYTVLLLAIHLLIYRFARVGLLIAVASGFALGIGGLVVFYHHFGAWHKFVEIVLPFTLAGHGEVHSVVSMIFGQSLGDENVFTSFFGNPFRFLDPKTLFDYSAFLLFFVAVLVSSTIWHAANRDQRRLMTFILLTTLIVPPIMHAAGHYRSYYRWMTYMPLAIVVPKLLEMARELNCDRSISRFSLGVACFSFMLGVPLHTAALIPGWAARSTVPLNEVVANVVKPSDVVVCNYKAYFAIRPRVQLLFGYSLPARGEFERIVDFPSNDISLYCILPENLKSPGANWQKLSLENVPGGKAMARSRYPLDFYRRVPNGFAPP